MKDFFTRYRESRKHIYIVPGLFGLMFAFTLVTNYKGESINFASIQANILEANTENVQYGADLLLEWNEEDIIIRIGNDAQNIETLFFSLLGDPTVFQNLTTQNAPTIVYGNEPGIFLVKIELNRSVKAGEILTTLTPKLIGKTSLALVDAGFTSSGITYNLSTKSE